MHDLFQALEIAVVTICLDEAGIRPLVDIALGRNLEAAAILRHEWRPARIDGRGLTERVAVGEKAADAAIDERRATLFAIAAIIRLAFGIIGKVRIGWRPDIACRKIGKQGIFARPAIAVAAVALRLAAKQAVSLPLLRCELCLSGLHRVIFRG
jgi:hypothetical protein